MLKLTKATQNLATKNGLDVCVDLELGHVLIFSKGDDENILEYVFNEDRTELTFKFQVYGNKIEDLPAHINNTKLFNQVIKYVGSELVNL